ncbi:MAG: ABC transporter ATP-binding protein, partial [Acinetobacter sp.]|nr:ABC transporter ATP-binding protein [Acinetobacter sp.]
PNVLILDEPTNHLDLDMRHALSMALQDFEGAVVLVSHERQLIASVCDDLLLVHDGKVNTFDGDLQDYAQWLKQARQQMLQQQSQATQVVETHEKTVAKVDKEAQRKAAARRREMTRPLRKKIEQHESQIDQIQQQLVDIEQQLADSSLYDAARKADLLALMTQQTEQKNALATLEDALLTLLMELEELEQSLQDE